MSPKIIHPNKEAIVYVSGSSVGGSGYIVRVLREVVNGAKTVHVIVRSGSSQETVIRAVKSQLALLGDACTVDFTVTIAREKHVQTGE